MNVKQMKSTKESSLTDKGYTNWMAKYTRSGKTKKTQNMK